MVKSLFVNFRTDFANGASAETKDSALVTTSYLQGLQWITHADLPLAGIYLNPSDASYSALRFIALAFLSRPATPFYILDEAGDLSSQQFAGLAEKFKISGAINGKKSLNEVMQATVTPIPENLQSFQKRNALKSEYPGYLAIPLIDFIYAKRYPCNVFIKDENNALRFFGMEGSEVDLEYLAFLSKTADCLYIEEASQESKMASFRMLEASYLDPGYLSPSWRTAEVLFRAKTLQDQMKKNGVTDRFFEQTSSMLADIFQLTSQLNGNAEFKNLVTQAQRCDRSLACVTLTTILCSHLKFSKSTIVETLGFASILQDLSLYRTPFGDLSTLRMSELPEEALKYYLNHPNLSAEMVSRIAEISEVTLQIIRQHHERSDRTGFPAKIGGTKLQPLAEILSLVNSYLDRASDQVDFYSHYSERIVTPFRQLLKNLEM